VVGLGNPGPRYASTRHNLGFRLVSTLAVRHAIRLEPGRFAGRFGVAEIASQRVGLLAPSTWMNRSGDAVAAALAALPDVRCERDLIVAYDDLDLPFGQLRLRPRGGAGGHRGVESLIESLGHPDFARLRFGIGRPPPGRDVVEYVLEDFSPGEQAALGERLELAADAIESFVREGIALAMDRYNRAPAPPSEP